MNRTIIALLFLAAFAADTPNSAAQSHALAGNEEAAIRAVVAEFAKSWNRHDMKAMHELNTNDVEWINVSGNHWRGNADVYKGHDAIHRTVFANTGMSIEGVTVRPLTPDVAVAVTTMKFGPHVSPSGQKVGELKTRASFVLIQGQGAWKVSHFHNTILDPKADEIDPLKMKLDIRKDHE